MASRSKKTPTIYQVAEAARVSPATVSRVLNGIRVDPELARRVTEAAEELNFVRSQTAINLSRSRTQTVGMLVPDLTNPTFQAMLSGLDRAAAADGYWVLVADSHENTEDEVTLAREMRRRTDALVLCSPRMDSDDLQTLLPELGNTTVINRYTGWLPAPVAAIDYRSGIETLLGHLVELGHNRITYLAGNPRSASNTERSSGIGRFLEDRAGVEVSTLPGGVTFADGFRSAERILEEDTTAIVCFNDLVAMGLLSALHERGVSVPEELSVVGFDDIPFAAYTTPPLTTVSTAAEQIGALAWQRTLALIEGRTPPANELVSPRLVTRASTAAPRAGTPTAD